MEMTPRKTMCQTCPFRGISEEERRELAVVEPEAWGCHTENPWTWTDIQCRGHYEARKKYPPSAEDVAVLNEWRRKMDTEVKSWITN
jgi:hypothetical protein